MKTHKWLLSALGAAMAVALVSRVSLAAEAETGKAEKAEPAKAYTPEPAAAKQDRINVRGQANINSEVVTRLRKGQLVTVLEEIALKKPKTDEPAQWYRIALPTNTAVYVHGDFVDKTNKTVRPAKLNMRSGPGENYSILGRLEKGTALTVLGERGDWIKIAAPENAYGFVAAHLLQKNPAAELVAAAPPTNVVVAPPTTSPPKTSEVTVAVAPPPPVTTEVVVPSTNVIAVAPAAIVSPALTNAVAETNKAVVVTPSTNLAVVVPTPPEQMNSATNDDDTASAIPPPELIKRIVTREGMLKGSVSIQAPTYFELRSLENNRIINYVHSPSTNIVLKNFKGRKVQVTGEELLDERWPNVPVITVDQIIYAP